MAECVREAVRPAQAGIDPRNLLIDLDPEDDMRSVSAAVALSSRRPADDL
jgi:hypothetical protein